MKFEYETSRLILRVLAATDEHAQQVLDFYNRNQSIFDKYDAARPEHFFTLQFQFSNLHCEYQLFLRLKNIRFYLYEKQNTDKIIGTVCFYNITQSVFQSCRIGYKIDSDYWRMGYAKEALSYATQIILKELPVRRIEAYVMPDNIPSLRLLDSLHFQQEGCCRQFARIKDKWEDHLLYSLLKDDFTNLT